MKNIFLPLALLLFLLTNTLYSQSHPKIDPYLSSKLTEVPEGTLTDIYVVLKERLSYQYLESRTFSMQRKEKQREVVRILKEFAAEKQANFLKFLRTKESEGTVKNIQVNWAINVISLKADPQTIYYAAENFNEVEKIHYDATHPIEMLIDDNGITAANEKNNFSYESIAGNQPGLTLINAPQVWAMGDSGQGVLVANIDTGTDWKHPDLRNNIWNNLGEDANGNGTTVLWNGSAWVFDPGDINGIDDDGNGLIDDFVGWNWEGNNNDPSSGSSHGTATSGIVAGYGTGGTQTGVAPRAKVMILKTNAESQYWLGQQYAIDKGADIVTSSLSYKWYFNPKPNYPMFRQMNDMELAAGMLHTNSTSNDGGSLSSAPIPFNISAPGNSPGPWIHPDQTLQGGLSSVIGSANVHAATDLVVTSSPHGPATWEDIQANNPSYPYVMPMNYRDYPYQTQPGSMGLIKPDIAAPGDGTTSTAPGTGYQTFGGTSGATPHLAGVAALLFSVNPNLTPSAVSMIMQLTAVEKGAPGKDNRYGAGRVDAWEAFLMAAGEQDSIPPTTVTDLSVTGATSNSLTITWTAPFDSSVGGVIAYDLRMSNSPITDTTAFSNAMPVDVNPPDTAGATETLLVQNLTHSSNYYFAIRSKDIWGNVSAISNSSGGTTWGAPSIAYTPASIQHILDTNQVVVDTILISNATAYNSTLDYIITMENHVFPSNLPTLRVVPLFNDGAEALTDEKDKPNQAGGIAIEGQGGPDAFGYKWIDSDEPNGPQYVWNDISTTGTLVTNWIATGTWDPKDEGYGGPFPLGFSFKYYGQVQNQVYVSSNGFIMFTQPTANSITNAQIPNAAYPNGYIAPFWDDLDGRTQGTVHYKADPDKFTIQFTNWQKYSATGSLTFQVVLYSGGRIMFYYNNMNAALNSATVGIENPTGTIGLQVVYNAAYVKNNLAVKFAAEPDWLSHTSASGTIHNGNQIAVILTFRSEDFPLGDYSMDMKITSNDPLNPTVVIPINMTVVPVELTSFTAEADRDEVKLKWSTASEVNNSGFSVERKNETGSWNEIAFVKGSGTTTELINYSYTDKELKVGSYSYRLKQIDFDGTFEYSKEIEINVELPLTFSLSQNYPNPFNPSTTIEYSLPYRADVSIEIYSILGELVSSFNSKAMEAGYHRFDFNASRLTSGTYIYRLTAKSNESNFTETKKMLFLK
jgi:subtilisin family serine protease